MGDGIFGNPKNWTEKSSGQKRAVLSCLPVLLKKEKGMGKYTKCQKGFSCSWCVKVIYNGKIKGKHQMYTNFYTVLHHRAASGWKNHALQTQWIVSKSLRLAIGRILFFVLQNWLLECIERV